MAEPPEDYKCFQIWASFMQFLYNFRDILLVVGLDVQRVQRRKNS